jgi:PAS domain S-box-containing protein
MMTARKLTYEELESRLFEAQDIIGALRKHEVDAIVGDEHVAVVRLREVEEALHRARAELEQRVTERTADLARANCQLQEIIQEQERTRQQLEGAEKRLLQAQHIARIGNWEWNPQDDTLWWSQETYRLFGLEPGREELSHARFLCCVHPEDQERVEDLVVEALEHKHPYTTEFRILLPDGQERFIRTETEIALDEKGNVARVTGIAQDITERKRSQCQLEEYTGQLRDQAELLDLAHDMIFVHDMDGRITFWNRGAEQAYGWKREEALGQLSHKLLRTEYAEPLIRITARIIKEGWWEGELVHTTRDGQRVTVASRWALRKKASGRPVAILEIDNDITERKQAEQEMAAARGYAESIVDTVREALVVLDPQWAVLSANRSFHDTFGLTPEQTKGCLLFTLNNGMWDVPELRRKLAEVLSRNADFQDFELECAGPQPQAFVLSARPVHRSPRGAGMVLLAIRDITVHKRQQREIEADKQQLALLTEELMIMEERQRRQIATTLHDSIGQSLIFAKRELGALQGKVPPEVQKSLRQVAGQIADAIKQTRDLTFELSPATLYTFGLQAAVEELAEQFAECGGFACRVEGPGEPMPITEQVRAMLYRSVRELLVNVAKHAGAGNVVIAMGHDGRNVRVVVQDDGRGFATGTLDECSREHGFGLFSIRERLVHVGGKFDVESVEGEGTRVTLVAPLDLGQRANQEFQIE